MTTYIFYQKIMGPEKSYELTMKGLRKYLQYIGRETDLRLVSIKKKDSPPKPYFDGIENVYHNVSHSGDWWVGAYGNCENGVDLQKINPKNQDKLAKRFLHEMEYRWLCERPSDQFYRIWAYNESYVKFIGDGLTKGLNYFSTISKTDLDSKDNRIHGVDNVFQKEIPFPHEGYYLVLTTKNQENVILEEL